MKIILQVNQDTNFSSFLSYSFLAQLLLNTYFSSNNSVRYKIKSFCTIWNKQSRPCEPPRWGLCRGGVSAGGHVCRCLLSRTVPVESQMGSKAGDEFLWRFHKRKDISL